MLTISYDDTSNYLLFENSEKFNVTTPERKVLVLLIINEGDVCTRKELMNEAWGHPEHTGTNSLNVAISNLRKILRPKGFNIKTIPRKGYMLDLVHPEIFINDIHYKDEAKIDNDNENHSSDNNKSILYNLKNKTRKSRKKNLVINIFCLSIIFLIVNLFLFLASNIPLHDITIENDAITLPIGVDYNERTAN